MGSSQHTSPHQARVFRRGLGVVTCACEISLSRRTQWCHMFLLVRISISNGKIKLTNEAYGRECDMGWSHHTSRSESQQHECEKWAINSQTLQSELLSSAVSKDLVAIIGLNYTCDGVDQLFPLSPSSDISGDVGCDIVYCSTKPRGITAYLLSAQLPPFGIARRYTDSATDFHYS